MRVIFVTPYLPSPMRARSYNLLINLAERGHEITLVSLQMPPREPKQVEAIRRYCRRIETIYISKAQSWWNCLKALPTSGPLQAAYCLSREMNEMLQRTLRDHQFDIAHVEHLRAAHYGLVINGLPKVYDSVDCITLLFQLGAQTNQAISKRLLLRLDLERTRSYERSLVRAFDGIVASSQADKEALERLGAPCGRDKIRVVPNGVNLDYFSPPGSKRKPASLVFLGRMSYHANVASIVDFCRSTWPLILSKRPDAQLVIVGADPSPRVRALAGNNGISVTGYVPDVRPYLAQATISISPLLYGAGTQYKVLEAMAMGTPVVATPQVCTGLQASPGEDLLVGETSESFAGHVLDLLENPGLHEAIGSSGRKYVEGHHDWRSIAGELEETYLETSNPRQAAANTNGG